MTRLATRLLAGRAGARKPCETVSDIAAHPVGRIAIIDRLRYSLCGAAVEFFAALRALPRIPGITSLPPRPSGRSSVCWVTNDIVSTALVARATLLAVLLAVGRPILNGEFALPAGVIPVEVEI